MLPMCPNTQMMAPPGETRTPDLRFRNELKLLKMLGNIAIYNGLYNNSVGIPCTGLRLKI